MTPTPDETTVQAIKIAQAEIERQKAQAEAARLEAMKAALKAARLAETEKSA